MIKADSMVILILKTDPDRASTAGEQKYCRWTKMLQFLQRMISF